MRKRGWMPEQHLQMRDVNNRWRSKVTVFVCWLHCRRCTNDIRQVLAYLRRSAAGQPQLHPDITWLLSQNADKTIRVCIQIISLLYDMATLITAQEKSAIIRYIATDPQKLPHPKHLPNTNGKTYGCGHGEVFNVWNFCAAYWLLKIKSQYWSLECI